MKSGLEDRNNQLEGAVAGVAEGKVSMKSGLEDRNNEWSCPRKRPLNIVSQ